MMHVLIVYSTVDGHTKKICEFIADILKKNDCTVEVQPIEAFSVQSISACDRFVIGASIRYGKHSPLVEKLVCEYREQMLTAKAAFFSVNLVARKPQKRSADTNPYVKKFLNKMNWVPACTAVFAGRLNYPAYGFWDKNMIRFIMWLTKGPTDPKTDCEFTDWQQVAAFAERIAGPSASTSTRL